MGLWETQTLKDLSAPDGPGSAPAPRNLDGSNNGIAPLLVREPAVSFGLVHHPQGVGRVSEPLTNAILGHLALLQVSQAPLKFHQRFGISLFTGVDSPKVVMC